MKMSRRLVDIYVSLKDLLKYVGTQLSINYSSVTLSNLWATFVTNEGSLSNLTALENIFNDYIIPEYQDNSCLKVTREYYYFANATLSVSDLLNTDEINEFLMRLKAFTKNCQVLIDRLDKYVVLIPSTNIGKSKTTTATLKNNDTPQISGSGATQNDGFTNNVQINTGTENETPSITEQLDALKYVEDIKLQIANMFRNEVLID